MKIDIDWFLVHFEKGHVSYSHGGYGCDYCPLVVDPLSFAALTGFIAFATYFFQVQIEMSMLMMAKRKRRSTDFLDLILNQGKQFSQLLSLMLMKDNKSKP